MAEQPTNGTEWRQPREQGYLHTLPSGHSVYLRQATPALLIEQMGEIPDHLTPLVSKMIFGPPAGHAKQIIDSIDPENDSRESLERTRKAIDFANVICKMCFVTPKIVEQPRAENEIAIHDVDLGDRLFVLSLVTQPAEVLRSFRLKKTEPVATLPDSEGDQRAA
jgi:hypothetical protein